MSQTLEQDAALRAPARRASAPEAGAPEGQSLGGGKLPRWLPVAAILLAGCVAYARVLGDYFVMDDFQLLERASRTPWWAAFRSWPSFEGLPYFWMAPLGTNPAREPAYFRPLEELVYWSNYRLWGTWPLPYHLFSLLLHLAVALLVYRVARRFTPRAGFAALAGVLFALHPVHAEAVQWVAAISDPLAALFVLLALDGWLRGPTSGSWIRGAAPLACYGLALLCKESAIVLPFLLLATCLLPVAQGMARGAVRDRLRLTARRLWPFWLVTGAYAALHAASTAGLYHDVQGSRYLHSICEPGFVVFALFDLSLYLWDLLIPLPLYPVDIRDLVPQMWPAAALAAGLLVLLALAARRYLRSVPGAAFFALWPLLAILPVLPVLPGQRFLYLPSVGFCWAVALVVERFWLSGSTARVRRQLQCAIVLVALGYAGLANLYQAIWGIPGDMARSLVADVRRSNPSLPKGSRVFLANLWSPVVRLPDALRLEYGDPTLNVEILTCSPRILPIREKESPGLLERLFCSAAPGQCGPSRPQRGWLDASTLRLWLPENERYGQTLVEGLLPTRAWPTGARARGSGFEARVIAADAGGIRCLDFGFDPRSAGEARLFFEYRGGHLIGVPGPSR
jgi:hypothetical protein